MPLNRIRPQLNQVTGKLHWIHWCVLIASLVLTLSTWYISKKAVQDKIATAFDREASQVVELISERMQKYEDALWAGVAAIHSQRQGIDYQKWQRFTQTLEIETKYPGVNGIGVIYYVPPESLAQFLDNERQRRPDFRIYPKHERNEYWPITYIEPLASNRQAVGLDMAHEINRYTAALNARDSGKAQITGPIVLVQDAAKTPGFLFYVPYYSSKVIDSVEERRKHFVGLVYAPFIMSKLMKGTLEKEKRYIGIKITDGESILYDEHTPSIDDYDADPLFTRHLSLDFYGRPWEIDLRSSLDFRDAANSHQPVIILISGLIIEGLLIFLFVALARANKAASTALEASEKSRQTFIDASGDGYWDWYIQKDYEYMSPQFWKMFGYSPDEKPHSPSAWQDMIFEEDLAVALDNFDKHVASKGEYPYEQEVRYQHKDGSAVTVLCRGRVIEWDEQQQPVRMIGTHTNITELKQKTQALEKALAFQKLLMNVNTDLIFVKDKAFRIVEANPAFLALYPEDMHDKIIGRTTVEEYSEEQANEFLSQDKKAFAEGVSEVVETIDFPDGNQRTLLTKKLRFDDVNNNTFILGIARDITQLKKVEEALVRANTELEEFSYRTSHDLRSPLISSTKLLSIIRDNIEKGDTEKAVTYIDIVQESLKKLENLVSDILRLAKLNHTDMPYVSVDIEAIVSSSLHKFSHMDNYHRIAFVTQYSNVRITAPIEHITLVIENLLSNAIKYQDTEKEESFVKVSTQQLGDRFILTIIDNGLGVPERSQQNLFMMFKRFHPGTAFGSGLGLYMVKKSVEKMGGDIQYSDTGEGSRFTITLPLNQ